MSAATLQPSLELRQALLFPQLVCSKCRQEKPRAAFSPDAKCKTGCSSLCKDCRRQNAAQRRRRQAEASAPLVPLHAAAGSGNSASALFVFRPVPHTSDLNFTAVLNAAPDFGTACRIAAHMYRRTGNKVKRKCEREGLAHDAGFWHELATDAEQAAAIYETFYQECPPTATQKTLLHLGNRAGMDVFADALKSGAYGEHLGW